MTHFSTSRQDGITVLHANRKNFDAGTAPEFLQSLAVIAKQSVQVVVDLSTVEFVDSSGLGALLAAIGKVTPGFIRLAGVSGRLMPALGRLRERLPPCHETVDDAVVAFWHASPASPEMAELVLAN